MSIFALPAGYAKTAILGGAQARTEGRAGRGVEKFDTLERATGRPGDQGSLLECFFS